MGFKNFLEFFQFNDEDDDFDDDDEEEIVEERRLTKRGEKVEPERPVRPTTSQTTSRQNASASRSASNDAPSRPSRTERTTASNKVVPIKPRNLEVSIAKPTSFADAQDICDLLMNGRAAVVNLEGFDPVEAQRIMDFVSGCIYTMNGRFRQISKYIFIFAPENVDISGDYQDYITDGSFGVPTINKDF